MVAGGAWRFAALAAVMHYSFNRIIAAGLHAPDGHGAYLRSNNARNGMFHCNVTEAIQGRRFLNRRIPPVGRGICARLRHFTSSPVNHKGKTEKVLLNTI